MYEYMQLYPSEMNATLQKFLIVGAFYFTFPRTIERLAPRNWIFHFLKCQ